MSENGKENLLEKTAKQAVMDAGMAAELTDAELGDVGGGRVRRCENGPIHDGRGRVCGQMVNGSTMYRPCPSCGKPLYCSEGHFCCDTCKKQWGAYIKQVRWFWGKDRLVEFSNTNV